MTERVVTERIVTTASKKPVWEHEPEYPLLRTEAAISMVQNEYGRLLLGRLLLGRKFGEVTKTLREFLATGPSWDEFREERRNVAGSLFQAILPEFLTDGLEEKEIVVPEEDVLGMFQVLYPGNRIITVGVAGKNRGLEGVSVPDALLLTRTREETKLSAIVECSLVNPIPPKWRGIKRDSHSSSFNLFSRITPTREALFKAILGRWVRINYPQFPPRVSLEQNLKVLYIAPRGNELIDRLSNEEVWFVPFTREEFYRVLKGFFKDVKRSLV